VTTIENHRLQSRRNLMRLKANILCMGNHIAGSEISQKRKNVVKSLVVIPADSGRWFAENRRKFFR
jgi:hypothetical protein